MDSTIRVICKITVNMVKSRTTVSLVSVNSNSAEDSKFRFLSNDKNNTKTVLGFVTWPDANICQSGIMSSHKGPYRPDAIRQRDANFQFSMDNDI